MKKTPITMSNNPVITVKFGSATVGVTAPIKNEKKGYGIELAPIAPDENIKNGDHIPGVPRVDGIRVKLEFTSVKSINTIRAALDRIERALVNEFLNT